MAKKKKPAVNPARGFATTSIASKPKSEASIEQDVISPQAKADDAQVVAPSQNGVSPTVGVLKERELHELTPEELTARLEHNELQQLVETLGSKVRREVSRLDSKLRSDSRVLRSQAQDVSLRKWLPEELMLEVLDAIRKERDESMRAPIPAGAKTMPEDELLLKCWILLEALVDFGIPLENAKQAIAIAIERQPKDDGGGYVWGFRESIEFLALDLDEDDLPHYDTRTSRTAVRLALSSNENSGMNTPLSSPETSPRPKHRRPNGSAHEAEPLKEGVDVHASDFESDVEPDDLVSSYLAMKERLYRHKPDLVEAPTGKGKKGKQQQPPLNTKSLKPNENRLRTKMKFIEADMLFDRNEAQQRWDVRRIEIMQELSSSRTPANGDAGKLKVMNGNGARTLEINLDDPMTPSTGAGVLTTDVDDILGSMFGTETSDVPTMEGLDSAPDSTIVVREMGKLSGPGPRRILEDACKGKDGKAKVSFKRVSKSNFAMRHSVSVFWATDQERITADMPAYLKLEQRASQKSANLLSGITLTMTDVACSDVQQSEAFIATCALHYVTQKGEKQYVKLPPSFRDLYLELEELEKQGADAVDREKLKIIRDMISAHTQRQEDDGIILSAAFRNRALNSPRPGSSRGTSPSRTVPQGPNAQYTQLWHNVQSSPSFQHMLHIRMSLPMFTFKQAALHAISENQVIILCGETGCGKSTQLPSYVLEHELSHGKNCKIYCTQPRRISAISLAQRVSEELGEQKGDVGTSRSLVGYAIRLESKVTSQTRLVYATVGVVLRMLESSKSLDDITHLILDEVHERSIDTDFLLIVLKALMLKRPELKVVLMSATVDATRFSRYLDNAPIINVPGRTFPVQTKYLEDAIELTGYRNEEAKPQQQDDDDELDATVNGQSSGIPKQLQGYSTATRETLSQYDEYRIDFDLIVRLMEVIATDPGYADYSKATLVFLPGISEIRQLNDLLTGSRVFQHNCWVIPLHSTIASEDQQAAFQIPPRGVRKVVLATNIAETGITIPDVTCVIDTGKHKEMRFDERRQLSRLIQSFISRANAKQRRGRAGRVQDGLCFHLFTKHRHDELMAEQQTPEMLRLSLQDLVMRVKICGLGKIEETLAHALDPPSAKNVRRAIDSLIEVGALTNSEDLTTLGSQLAKLPLDANLGKLCLISAIYGCLDVGLTISAILPSKSPFVTPFGDRQRADIARLSFAKGDSDLLTAYNAYTTWRRISQTPNQSIQAWCRKNYISHPNLCNIEDLKSQLLSSMADTGLMNVSRSQLVHASRGRQQSFVQVPAIFDTNSADEMIVQSVIAWSFYPKLLIRDGKGFRNVANSQQVSLHPTSVNKHNRDLKFLSYYSMMASSAGAKFYNALSTTGIADLPLLLLAGDADYRLHAGIVVIDGNRLRFKLGSWKDALALKILRLRLRELVDVSLRTPGKETTGRLKMWLDVWVRMCQSFEEKNKRTL